MIRETDTSSIVREHARIVHSLAARGLTPEQIAGATGLLLAVVQAMLRQRRR